MKVDADNLILKIRSRARSYRTIFRIYANLFEFNDIGLNKGVHVWSVKLLLGDQSSLGINFYSPSIGVTTKKSDQSKLINKGYNSISEGIEKKWTSNQVMTVKLNCNNWTVTYFKDYKQVKWDKIKRNKRYFFALLCRNRKGIRQLEIVENLFDLKEDHTRLCGLYNIYCPRRAPSDREFCCVTNARHYSCSSNCIFPTL